VTAPASLHRSLHNRFSLQHLPGLFESPLRWYLALLLIGAVASIGVGNPIGKFQIQRLVEVGLALGLLAWCYRPQAASWLGRPIGSGWYGLGLLGCAVVTGVASALGPIPWISMGFLGLVLLQFGLMPLLVEAWRQRKDESFRLLALLAVALVGIDVGLWLVMRAFELQPYVWLRRLAPGGRELLEAPYLYLNSRWANQISVLLLWTFIPLLEQLQQGLIQVRRRFWWGICWAVPLLCCTQFVLSRGDGAFLATWLGLVALWWQWRRCSAPQRSLWGTALRMVLVSMALALGLSMLLDAGSFLQDFSSRNAQEFTVGSQTSGIRLSTWLLYLRNIWLSPLWGQGIQAIPGGASLCGPHNIWVALLYWCGLAGTGFALLLTTGFVPWGKAQWQQASPMALPFLVSLFIYQLVDDIWLRPLSLALLLVLLPSLLPAGGLSLPAPPLVQRFTLSFERYRLLALVGVLLIVLSVVLPGGIGRGPSDLVSLPNQLCLLFF
jgi:hypothetical protein